MSMEQWKQIDEALRSKVVHQKQAHQQYRSISLESLSTIRSAFGLEKKALEIRCLGQGIIPEKYWKNIGAVGIQGQVALLESRLGIAGTGGLGGHVVELAARMGIGAIVCMDGDEFDESNLNRQILSRYDSLGQSKATAAMTRIGEINPSVEATAILIRGNTEDFTACFKDCHVVIDCLDSAASRQDLLEAAKQLNIPWVHGAVAGFRGQVMTVFPEDQRAMGLLQTSLDGKGAEKIMGTPSASPAMVAAWQVQEAVKIITGKGTLIRNRMLIMDAYQGTVQIIKV